MANEILGTNQGRANKRPEEIREENFRLTDLAKGMTAEGVAEGVADATPGMAFAKFVQESPLVKGAPGRTAAVLRKALPFASMSGAGGKGMLPVLAFGAGYGTGRAIDKGSKFLPGMGGEEISTKLARGMAPEVFENANLNSQPAFNAPTLQALADQRAQGAMTEDDKVDSLQSALQGVPDAPQVVPGTLPTAQESGQRLMDAAKEFYPGAFAPEAPAASGLSPDALKAIQSPTIPESVTSAEVPAGLGPLRPVDPRTGEFLSPEVIAAGEQAGLTFPSQVALPESQAQAPIAPMGEAETTQRLQSRFGAPTIRQLQQQAPSAYDDASAERDQRLRASDRQPGESQAERDTRNAQSKTQQSVSAAGRKYTDSQLRRLFPNDADYQAARVKDTQGMDPLTNQDYADQDLDRSEKQSRIDARDRGAEEPTNAINAARADAEQIAQELYGLEPGSEEYDSYVRDSILEATGALAYIPPTPTYTAAEADAAHAAGKLKIDDEYLLPDGTPQKYAGPTAAEEKKPRPARGRGGRARQNKRNQEDQ